jgi:hypothetical protein
MGELRERATLLEEALHPVAEGGQVLVGDRRQHVAVAAQRERGRQVFLDRDRLVGLVVREIHDRKAARGEHLRHAVVLELVALGQRDVRLRRHGPRATKAFVKIGEERR